MKTNTTIVKALAFAILLATACNKNEIANDENAEKKGFALPVTVNVTREGDNTKATFNESTRKLEFSAGDKLFVSGNDNSVAGQFAGELTWQSGGTFSGTINIQNSSYEGTADDLFTAASAVDNLTATLLPNGYESYNFLSIDNSYSPAIAYDDEVTADASNAFVASETAKATGVEQLSFERTFTYSSGFALAPVCAVLNFTISGLEAGAQDVTLYVTRIFGDYTVTGSVTPNASGVATFAIGVPGGYNIKDGSNNLTVGSHNFTLPGGTALAAGKIYNITRSTGATVNLSTINENYTASNGVTLTGTLASNVQISIADGATVILNGVSINAEGLWTTGNYAGITCLGNATIILSGTNTVKGFWEHYPGIYVPVNKTVTIQGTGSLTASSNGWGAGIGGGYRLSSGNVLIKSGTIVATGGHCAAGIGSGGSDENTPEVYCGTITITGGDVTATGGTWAAGIGSGGADENTDSICGAITITNTVTRVTATKGNNAPNSIGAGLRGTCFTVTIEDGANVTQN